MPLLVRDFHDVKIEIGQAKPKQSSMIASKIGKFIMGRGFMGVRGGGWWEMGIMGLKGSMWVLLWIRTGGDHVGASLDKDCWGV